MNPINKPVDANWTDDQWKAIVESGQNILVAAAAGSGKTAVLVERIIKKVTHPTNPVDVDRLLIVTFTNAAAAEMRKRIGEALEAELEKKPSSLYLRRQITLLNRASISTLHSFCMNMLRKYYYKLDIDPAFRIVDETEAELIREEVLAELFEEEYSKEDNNGFYQLVDWYSNDRSDDELQSITRQLYDFSRAYPWPDKWLEKIRESYSLATIRQLGELPWINDLLEDIRVQVKAIKQLLEEALLIVEEPEGPTPYYETITSELAWVKRMEDSISWDVLYDVFSSENFGKLKSCKKGECDPVLQTRAKELREKAKEQVNKVKEEFFMLPPEVHLQTMKALSPYIDALIYLVKEYGARFEKAKLEKGLVDFNDLEHYCLQLLCKQDQVEEVIPSEVAIEIQQSFAEVLVDEYQDTNLVQETILKLVTTGFNMFMVGDVKQSIYRFRLADPGLFLTKYKQYGNDPSSGLRIDLSKNFRSRKEVLDGTNFIFKQIMNEAVGEIEYDEDAELKAGATYPDLEAKVEVLLVDRNQEYTSEEEDAVEGIDLETAEAEARVIAKQMKEYLQEPFQVVDKQTGILRNVTYRDFVILLRSFTAAPIMMEELKKVGIPSYAELSTGYFEAVEISIMLSVLKIIDNPNQEIPLVSVLRSPIVGLTEEELAQIRIEHKRTPFYKGITQYAQKDNELGNKLSCFLNLLGFWRERARQGSLAELIWQIYRDTRYYDFVGGLTGGKQRQANLRSLYDRAKQYESTSFRGLFRFLRFIERMQDRGDDLGAARALGEQEDVVRLMTIHKSKGLEFPIVFVSGINKQFNKRDLYDKVLFHKELGFGSKFIDMNLRISYPTLPFLAIKRRIQMELLAEEMRVLYVALTRAKEKLVLVGTIKDALKTIEKWSTFSTIEEWVLPEHSRSQAKSYLDWIGPALIRHPHVKECLSLEKDEMTEISQHSSKWNLQIIDTLSEEEIEGNLQVNEIEEAIQSGDLISLQSTNKEKVSYQLEWDYPYLALKGKRAKQTVTEIKRQQEQRDEYSDLPHTFGGTSSIATRPKFLQEKALTPAELGTAMHLVMQHVDVKKEISHETMMALLDQMVEQELMTQQQASEVNVHSILSFFSSDIGKRIQQAKTVYREVPFSLGIPSYEVYPDVGDTSDGKVLLQGVIDCLFEDDEGLVLVDYKTDRIPSNIETAKEMLVDRYQTQIKLYRRAVEEIWKKPVKEAYLYLFNGSYVLQL